MSPVVPVINVDGPGSREWAAARKRAKDTVLSWDFAALLEKEVCDPAGFQAQLNKAYSFASTTMTTSDAKGESCVTLTPDAVEKKLPGPVSWLLMFSSAMIDSIKLITSSSLIIFSKQESLQVHPDIV